MTYSWRDALSDIGKALNNKIATKIYYFNTVSDMKASNILKAGDMVITKGYYTANDGGNGEYEVVNDASLVDDGGSVHNVCDGLKAKLIIKSEINIKQFGAKCDGVTDDSIYIQRVLDFLYNNSLSLSIILPDNVAILNTVEKDLEHKFRIKIVSLGSILAKAQGVSLNLKGLFDSDLVLNFKDGGNQSLTDIAIKISNCFSSHFDIRANHYEGTVLNVDNENSSTKVGRCSIRLNCSNGCYRALLHGNETNYMDGFGEYNNITDFNSKFGSIFQNCADVTLKHYENYYQNETENSLSFLNAHLHCGVIAVGGIAKNLLFIKSYKDIYIEKLYFCNEDIKLYPDGTKVTNGLGIGDSANHNITINELTNNGCRFAINSEVRDFNNIGRLFVNKINSLVVTDKCKVLGVNNIVVDGYDINKIYKIEIPKAYKNTEIYPWNTAYFNDASNVGKYIKIASIKLTKQYEDVRLILNIVENSNDPISGYSDIIIGCQQSNALGNIPNVSLKCIDIIKFNSNFIVGNVTSNPQYSLIDIYCKISTKWSLLNFLIKYINKNNYSNIIQNTNFELLSELPLDGTKVQLNNDSYSKVKIFSGKIDSTSQDKFINLTRSVLDLNKLEISTGYNNNNTFKTTTILPVDNKFTVGNTYIIPTIKNTDNVYTQELKIIMTIESETKISFTGVDSDSACIRFINGYLN